MALKSKCLNFGKSFSGRAPQKLYSTRTLFRNQAIYLVYLVCGKDWQGEGDGQKVGNVIIGNLDTIGHIVSDKKQVTEKYLSYQPIFALSKIKPHSLHHIRLPCMMGTHSVRRDRMSPWEGELEQHRLLELIGATSEDTLVLLQHLFRLVELHGLSAAQLGDLLL